MPDLIDQARAQLNSELASLDTDLLAALITAASNLIERYCKRTFAAGDYTEYISGAGYPYDLIRLRNFPVNSIARVAANPIGVLMITNNPSTNQRATVATTSAGVILNRVASGVPTANTVTYSGNATLSALATAIIGVGGGWQATVLGGYELWPSVDIRSMQGAITAITGGACLEMFTEDLPTWGSSGSYYDPNFGWVTNEPGWRLDETSGELSGLFPAGQQNIRVDYNAGYSAIPDDVQEACVELVQDLYQTQPINSNLSSAKIGPFSYSIDQANTPELSPTIRALLSTYIDHSKTIMSGGR